VAATPSQAELAKRALTERPAFHVMAHPELMRYAANYSRAASGTAAVDPCMLAALVHRESGGQNILQYGMPAGPGCGVGLCQITSGVDWSNPATPVYPGFGLLLDIDVNLRVAATAFLDPLLKQFAGNHLAAFAAYNAGAGAVQNALRAGRSPDSVTAGGNYGSDVMATWLSFVASSLGTAIGTVSGDDFEPGPPIAHTGNAGRSKSRNSADADLSNE
jgi:hypothetical protein